MATAASQTVPLANPITDAVTAFAVGFRLEQAPAPALANAKVAILDCLGVSILANRFELGHALERFMASHAARGESTVWGAARTADLRDAVFANGTLAHGLDFDDRNHSSTYSLAVPFGLAEKNALSGRALLEAFIVGREVRNSLDALFAHRGAGIGPGSKGWHSNGILGPIASACAASRMMVLDPDRTRAAIGLAAGSSGALTRDGGTMAKPFRTGHAGATGLTCTLLASSGFTSDDTAIEGRRGLLDALGPLETEVIEPLARNLGKEFQLAKSIRGKRFASCSASHPGIEAMLRMRDARMLKPQDVSRITCDLKPFPLLRDRPRTGVEARFSLPFCLALALVKGRIRPGDFNDEMVRDPEIARLMSLVSHAPGQERLDVTIASGSVVSEPWRRAADLTTFEEIAGKFEECAEDILAPSSIGAVVSMCSRLETVPDVRELAVHLRAKPA